MHKGLWWANIKEAEGVEDLGYNIKMDLIDIGWTGFIWLRRSTNGGFLRTRQ
jgi:hypothetical protein